ncbi:hypothetical protein HF1_01660 [Mycoplasma haemofelis str. Langford 1]|uniref:Uncharacterized protein n=2 Tax=Mycoplasma haemofelis TaxID=29501 RepID=F6FG20_MYCHI|nr:hypothetical protein [Mycoplasma haemofelis]AEG72486.1 hypothetical protein MHF_0187 [Mycoplasma haemofelis Ohio2]CBY92174.1 hypothetical protein HF1_01660 [Mycoplasma haemofelis str. Langford 1]
MTSSAKLLSTAAATTGAAGTAGAIYFKPWEQKITIKQELEKLGKTILKTPSDSRWEIKEYIYKTTVSKTPTLKIDNKDTLTKDELSRWCLDVLDKPHSQDLHNKAKAFCLAPSIKDKLSKNSKTIPESLSTQVGNYKNHQTDDDLKIPKQEMENKEQNTLTEGDLKKWCNSRLELELSDGEDKNYKRVEKWCTSA